MCAERIAHLIKGLGRGGAETLLPDLIRQGPPGSRYAVGYFLPWKDALVEELRRVGATVTCFETRSNAAMLMTIFRVVRWLRREKADLVHAHLPLAGVVGRLAGRLAGVPVVYTEHNLQERYHPWTRRLNAWTWRLQDRVIAVSDEVAQSIDRHLGSRVPVDVVLNGIAVERFRPDPEARRRVRRELGIPPDVPVVVGTVAVFRSQKRLDVWLRVAAELHSAGSPARFLLVGDGPLRRKLEATAEELGIAEVVTWTGLCSDVRPYLAAMDVYLMSSAFEGLPLALLEAMAMELPVAATAVGGIPEVVVEGETGHLVAPEHPLRLATPVTALLEDEPRRRRFGRAGRARVEGLFGTARMAQEIEAIYNQVLAVGSPR